MKLVDLESFHQEYKGFEIMKEGNNQTFMIVRERKWYEFFMPREIAVARGIKTMDLAKQAIDKFRGESK